MTVCFTNVILEMTGVGVGVAVGGLGVDVSVGGGVSGVEEAVGETVLVGVVVGLPPVAV